MGTLPRISGAAVVAAAVLFGVLARKVYAVAVDQVNIPVSFSTGQVYNLSSTSNTPIGQEFIPSLGAMDFVDLFIEDAGSGAGPGANVLVNVRSATIAGSIVGTSLTTFVPDGTNTGGGSTLTRISFASLVPLVPGSTYVLEVQQTGSIVVGNSNFGLAGDNIGAGAYGNGRAIIDGNPVAGNDFWFREGVVPEPTFAGLVGFGSVLFASRRRSCQSHAF